MDDENSKYVKLTPAKQRKGKIFNHLPPHYEKARKLLKILKEADMLDNKFKGEYLGEVEYLQLWDTLIKMAKIEE